MVGVISGFEFGYPIDTLIPKASLREPFQSREN